MIKKLFLTLFICLFLSLSAFGETFYIKNYDVDLKVDNTKNVHVTETIDVFFTAKSHGIFRDIPAPKAEVTNIKVSEKNKVEQGYDKYTIKIGDGDKYLIGDHTYQISYDYRFFDNKNEFYFNIIGTDWNSKIEHAGFNIEMPRPIDDSKTGLSVGSYGIKGFSEGEAHYTVRDNNISGETSRTLQPREGITVRIEVPQGYFVTDFLSKQNIAIFLMLLCTLLCIIIWFIYGKDEKPIPVVSFYPPKEKDVLDVELVYNEKATTRGIVAMIVDLAHKGYLKISNNQDGFVFEKGKNSEESSGTEKTLLNALFEDKKNKNSITEKKLKHSSSFYKTISKILSGKNEGWEKMYESEEINKSQRKILQYIIGFLGVVLAFVCANFSTWGIFKGLLIAGASVFAQWFIYLGVTEARYRNIVIIIINVIVLFPAYFLSLFILDVMYYIYPICFLGYFCLFVSTFCYYHMQKRTKENNRELGEIEGFRQFIKTAEINKLQMLVEEDPEYFYNILPYAYIFNLSKKWIKKFENLVIPDSAWCEGSAFNEKEFTRFLKTMDDLSNPTCENGGISSSSSSGSYHSSSSGGGGFSGGGGGGGGGRSW